MTAQLSRERLEALANLQSLECMALPASHAESAEMARVLLAGMGTAVAGFDAATAIRACMEEFPEHVHDIVEECAQIAENTISTRHSAPPAQVALPDDSAVELLATDLMKRIDKITGERHSVATLSSLRVSIVEACRAAMLKAGPATAAKVPDGWKLVPVEPTEAMLDAAYSHPASAEDRMRKQYASMLSAAPAAPEKQNAQQNIPGDWIKCCERMPEKERFYLVWVNASKVEGYYDHTDVVAYQGEGHWSNEFGWCVTHWMPLPSAPEQEV